MTRDRRATNDTSTGVSAVSGGETFRTTLGTGVRLQKVSCFLA